MTTDQVIQVLRRYLDQVDTSTSDLTDEELLAEMSDARDLFEIEQITGFEDLAVGYDQTDEDTYGIIPDPDLDLGHLLALRAAAAILRKVYAARLRRGEIGITWTSGLESESTLQAGKAYLDAIHGLDFEVERKVALKMASSAGVRQQ